MCICTDELERAKQNVLCKLIQGIEFLVYLKIVFPCSRKKKEVDLLGSFAIWQRMKRQYAAKNFFVERQGDSMFSAPTGQKGGTFFVDQKLFFGPYEPQDFRESGASIEEILDNLRKRVDALVAPIVGEIHWAHRVETHVLYETSDGREFVLDWSKVERKFD